MKITKILAIGAVVAGMIGMASCSKDEPEVSSASGESNGSTTESPGKPGGDTDTPSKPDYNFILSSKDLNRHLPTTNSKDAPGGDTFIGGPVDGARKVIAVVISEDGDTRYYDTFHACYELPARGGEYIVSMAEYVADEKITFDIYDNVDSEIKGDNQPDGAGNIAWDYIFDHTPDTTVIFEHNFESPDEELYGYAIQKDIPMANYGIEDMHDGIYNICNRMTRYNFPANTTGKPRLLVINCPIRVNDMFNTGLDLILSRNSYIFIQYAE